jgi:tripartite-type tricarboxylate transporter receptor subunit TctC
MTSEVAAFFDTPITALPQVQAGTVRALGVSTARRLAVAQNIPTIAEAGIAGYEAVGWNGVLAPANTPRPIIDRLNKAILASLKTPEMEKLLTEHRAGQQQPRRVCAADACRHRKMETGDARGRHVCPRLTP